MSWDFQHFDACENDEVRSGILLMADYGTTITLYDSPGGDKGDDYTVIKVKRLECKPLESRSSAPWDFSCTFETFEWSESEALERISRVFLKS